MDDSLVEEYRNKMLDWSLPLSQYSQQCQARFAPQSGSGLDIVENTEQGRQANQCRYPRPERRYCSARIFTVFHCKSHCIILHHNKTSILYLAYTLLDLFPLHFEQST